MKNVLFSSIVFLVILGLSGCATNNGYGFGYQNDFNYNDLPPQIKKVEFNKKYKQLPKDKVFAFAKSNTSGYYVFGMCSNASSLKDAEECAIKNCQKKLEGFMEIKNNQCKVYAKNSDIVWK